MFKIRRNWQVCFLFMAVIGLSYSCNQEYPNLIKNEKENNISVAGRTPKVLYVMMTGAQGRVVKKVVDNGELPKFKQMEKHAIYTYDGIADYKMAYDTMTVANGWMNMLTGVDQEKTDADTNYYANMKLNKYPTFVTRLKENKNKLSTAVYASSDVLKDSVLEDAAVAQSFHGDDQATVTATMDALSKDDSTSVFVTQLSGVEKAGETDGFNGASYMNAIVKAGHQVDDLMKAVENRENYEGENWLIIVASGKGGGPVQVKGIDETNYDDSLRNTFLMFYNKDFQQYFAPKPRTTSGAGYFEGKAARLYGGWGYAGVTAEVTSNDQSQFEPGTGAMTFEAKFKFDPNDASTNALIFSKGRDYGGIAGWGIRSFGESLTVQITTSDGKALDLTGTTKVKDNQWHTLALAIWKEGSIFRARFFIDNQLQGSGLSDSDPNGSITSTTNLAFGYSYYRWGDPAQLYVADVRIWDKHLPDDVIKTYSCFIGLPPSTHPYYNDLVGFWSCRDGSGSVFEDELDPDGTNDAQLTTLDGGQIEWNAFKDVSENVCPDPAPFYYQKVPNSVDIPFEIFNWLSISVPDSWNLDGKAWLTGYSDVRNPIN